MRRTLVQLSHQRKSVLHSRSCWTCRRGAFRSGKFSLVADFLCSSDSPFQIFRFQNKRQSMRQTNRQGSNVTSGSHQPFSMSDHMDDLETISPSGYESSSMGPPRPSSSQSPSSHRRARSQEEVADPRKWPRGY